MSYETCYSCGESGETEHDDDGGIFEHFPYGRKQYVCARCVRAEIAAEDAPGDAFEERKIREREK